MRARALVARNIRRLRVARDLSQEALAVDAGIDRTYVSRLERGLADPGVAVLEKLARASNLGNAFQALMKASWAQSAARSGLRVMRRHRPCTRPM